MHGPLNVKFEWMDMLLQRILKKLDGTDADWIRLAQYRDQ